MARDQWEGQGSAAASVQLRFSSFGVPVHVAVDSDGPDVPRLLAAVDAVLPPGRRPGSLGLPAAAVRLESRSGRHTVTDAEGSRTVWAEVGAAVHALDRAVRAAVSVLAPDHVFVHAGVVAGATGAIVLPGPSFAGKSTLVRALVAAGATYLSDEYAVLDGRGAVWPYARPLSMRTVRGRCDVPPGSVGTVAAQEAHPVVLVASVAYRAGGTWAPVAGTPGSCALTLVGNAVAGRTQPARVLASTAEAARGARFLSSERGAAEPVARWLLDLVGGPCRPSTSTPTHPTPAEARP